MRRATPQLPELPIAQWAEFARDPMSPKEREFLELQTRPREYASWCKKKLDEWRKV